MKCPFPSSLVFFFFFLPVSLPASSKQLALCAVCRKDCFRQFVLLLLTRPRWREKALNLSILIFLRKKGRSIRWASQRQRQSPESFLLRSLSVATGRGTFASVRRRRPLFYCSPGENKHKFPGGEGNKIGRTFLSSSIQSSLVTSSPNRTKRDI